MKHVKFRTVRRWANGSKFLSGPASRGMRKVNNLMAYWRRVGTPGTFIKPKRK